LGRKKYVYKNDSFVIQIKATYNVQEWIYLDIWAILKSYKWKTDTMYNNNTHTSNINMEFYINKQSYNPVTQSTETFH
jgi:hypothetical protein